MKREAVEELAIQLFSKHQLVDWRLAFDRAKRRAGQCVFSKKTISVSVVLMELYDEAQVKSVLLHEIAHALSGPKHGHDGTWKKIAARIGATPQATLAPDTPRPPAPWVGRCPRGHQVERFRTPSRVVSCASCDSRFNPKYLLNWTYCGKAPIHHPSYLRDLAKLQRMQKSSQK